MFKIDEKYNMHLNRGDQIIIRLNSIDSSFSIGDTIVFSIMKKGNASEILFQKQFEIEKETETYDIILTSQETRIGSPLKNGTATYWYEIEYNGINTLIGYFTDGPKEFILYPEAVYQEGSI